MNASVVPAAATSFLEDLDKNGAAVGNPHGGGEPVILAIVSVVINTPLFWGVIVLIRRGVNALRRSGKKPAG